MVDSYITLKEALESHRLEDFVTQQEARHLGPASKIGFDKAIAAAVKPPRSAGQTSHSPSRDGSAET